MNGGDYMSKQTLRATAIQKVLKLSEPEALKVLVFLVGMDAGESISENQRNPTKQPIQHGKQLQEA